MPVDPGLAVALVLAGVLYGSGVRRLARRGRRWPPARTASFAAGLVAVAVATQTAIERSDTTSFTAHMTQHVLLGMVAPLLVALSAPVTLALQASSRPMQRALLLLVRSPVVAALTHPVVGWVLFGGTVFVLYFTPLLELSLRNGLVHEAVHVHLVLAGSLFLWPALGLDPVRWRLPYGARLLAVLLAVPFHAFAALALYSARTSVAPGWYDLADQRAAAGVLWAVGDLFGLSAGAVVVVQWMRADARAAARFDRQTPPP